MVLTESNLSVALQHRTAADTPLSENTLVYVLAHPDREKLGVLPGGS